MPLSATQTAAPRAVPKVISATRLAPSDEAPPASSTLITTFEASPLCHCAASVWPVALKMAPVKKSANSVSLAFAGRLDTTTLRRSTSDPPSPAASPRAAAAALSAEAAMRSAAARSAVPRLGSVGPPGAAFSGRPPSTADGRSVGRSVAGASGPAGAALGVPGPSPPVLPRPRRRFFQGASEGGSSVPEEALGAASAAALVASASGPGSGPIGEANGAGGAGAADESGRGEPVATGAGPAGGAPGAALATPGTALPAAGTNGGGAFVGSGAARPAGPGAFTTGSPTPGSGPNTG
mmetsp:Transcript_14723/g.47073  ORF Transcript_14723/g.47073 Transcript_14723/m.47073 type:complete len:295 (-) Transcript_14723:73-957(-)